MKLKNMNKGGKVGENDLIKNINRVFITGDIHGDVKDFADRVESMMSTKDDLVIILGDCGFFYNCYYPGSEFRDESRRKFAKKLPCTILCVQGNHEQPFKEMEAEKVKIFDGEGYYRDGIYFADNGTEFSIKDKCFLILGGACSIDRKQRLDYGYPWWDNEELSQQEFDKIIVKTQGKHYDFILSHTVPYEDMPREAFIELEFAYTNDNFTEKNLQTIKNNVSYGMWYAGHFHIDKLLDKLRFYCYMWEQIL